MRIDLHGRRVGGWVVRVGGPAEVPAEKLKPLARVSSAGPPAEVVALARWAAWRWAGRWAQVLRTASPAVNVPPAALPTANLPRERARTGRVRAAGSEGVAGPGGVEVVRLAPAVDRWPLVVDAVAAGPAIVVVPARATAERMVARLRRAGHRVALFAGDVGRSDFVLAARGTASVVGTRVAVWAPVPDAVLRTVVVLDEHDEALQAEQAPTWHARDVAVERAARAGAACRLVSAVPTLHALDGTPAPRPVTIGPGERAGWPRVVLADRTEEDPVKAGLFSPALVRAVREPGRVVCVLNRLGRSRLLACVACGRTAECAACGAAVVQPADAAVLRCGHCGAERPVVCAHCGGGRFKNLRAGVTRAREELEALAGEPVVEVTAGEGDPEGARIAIGTEAVLHRLAAGSVRCVAFLDLDQELLAPRYRAAEQALALLARAARAVGGRAAGGGSLLLQTRLPDHPVVQAAQRGDPTPVADAERQRRRALRYPPYAAVAVVSGAGAPAWAATAPAVEGVEVLDGGEGTWLVRADDPAALADHLALAPRPAGLRLRVEVDPPRL